MGKRTNFDRKERDFYPTPYEAVAPLLPHLPHSFAFDEPCAGKGDLVNHLASNMRRISRMTDIAHHDDIIDRHDALKLTNCTGDMFITNPPWKWEVLNPLISHLSGIAPTWLLLNADVMHNERMGPHMGRCAKIVSVGRVSWMQNGKKGFENCAWFLFDSMPIKYTIFVGR